MGRFIVKELSFIDNRLVAAGAEIDFDGTPAGNLEAVDKVAKAAEAAANKLPAAVSDLVATVRLHAASRGVTPGEANESDIDAVVKALSASSQKPSADTIKAAAAVLGVTLGQSLA